MKRDQYDYIQYETVHDGRIAIVTLNRPDHRNAQHRGLLLELDEAFCRAEADDEVRVVVLRGSGPAFSSGHDLGSADRYRMERPGPEQHATYRTYGGTKAGIEKTLRQEWHFYFSNTCRWRDLKKITVASVHGKVYSAALMLMWACDLIVADASAEFADVVATRVGMCAVEYFAHPWELGARRAKELLLTGDSLDADEAHRIGMVSKVFPVGTLAERTIEFAARIAELPTATALLIKEAVNQTQNNQGFLTAIQAAFTLHQLNHAHWNVLTHGASILQTPELGATGWKNAPSVLPQMKDQAKAKGP